MTADVITVSFQVVEFRRVHSAGRLLALATVEIDLDGIALTVHGVQVSQLPNGRLQAKAPHYRTPTGAWSTAVTLPSELECAIGAEVLAMVTDP